MREISMRWLLFALIGVLLVVACTPQNPTGNFVLENDPCNGDDWCYFDLAQDNATFACPLIQDERAQSLCYIEAVKFDPQESYCDLVQADDQKYCYAELGIALEDYSFCDKSEDLSQQYCIEAIAEATNDKDRCDTLTAKVWKDACNDHFGRLLMDKVLCFSVKSENRRDSCVYNVSISSNDVDLCDSIVNTEPGTMFEERHTTTECVTDLAKANVDAQICENLDDSFQVEVCRYRVILIEDNIELCDDIKVSFIRDRCKERLSGNETVSINETITN
jgi:hypothetical protein